MGPWLALGSWWTRDHGAAQSLQGTEGHHDSSEIEMGCRRGSHQWHHLEAELRRWPHYDAQQRRRWYSDGEMFLGTMRRDWSWGGCSG
jgi:hypothetical protein